MSADARDPVLAAIDAEGASTLQQVVRTLRQAILDGRLAPGAALRETDLAARLGVSRGTIREALRVLAPEGLVEHRARRGALVASLDPADVSDVYRARIVLEAAAAEQAASGADLGGLRDAVSAMGDAAGADDVPGFVEAHAAFHTALVDLLGSDRLTRFGESLAGELRLGFAILDRLSGSLADSVAAHDALIGVLEQGNAGAARRALLDHLHHGAEDVSELPRSQG